MAAYQITVSYKGSNYLGWQIQKKQGKTIQGELYKASFAICHSEDIKIIAAGRTDAGVHALRQVFRLDIPFVIAPDSLKRALNSHLSQNIQVKEVKKCPDDFHPIRDAKWKEYHYFFTCEESNPFNFDLLVYYPYQLNEERMKECASLFVGKHDFCNYQCQGSEVKSTIRTIFSCDLLRYQSTGDYFFPMNYYILKVCGDGFLKQMVRLIMGVLWEVGRGKVSVNQVEDSLKKSMQQKLAPVAPAKGLFLAKVSYDT